jgi:hypothetical protein
MGIGDNLGKGVIYAIERTVAAHPDPKQVLHQQHHGTAWIPASGGRLLWYKHLGRDDGTFRWAAGAKPKVVGTGWGAFEHVLPGEITRDLKGHGREVAFGGEVLTHHNNNERTGANLNEVILKPSSVSAKTFGKLFTRKVDGEIYAQPLYLHQMNVPGHGLRNLVYVATMHNSVYAFDADHPAAAAPIWHAQLGPSVRLPDPKIAYPTYSDIDVEVGIVGTPVISREHRALYVVALTKEANVYRHRLHALDPATGHALFGGPTTIAATVAGSGLGNVNNRITFTSHLQIQRAALTLANHHVYVAFASFGDTGAYHGWVFSFDSRTLKRDGVFVTAPNMGRGGIWQSGEGLGVDGDGNLYFVTGNGDFTDDGANLSDCVVKVRGNLSVADWFSPYNNFALGGASHDDDLGSTGPLLISGHGLLLAGGKEGKFYLMRTTNMGHFHAGSDSQIVQSFYVNKGHHLHGSPVFWDFPLGPWVYVWPEEDFLRAYQLSGGLLKTAPISVSTTKNPTGVPGGSPGMPGGFLSLSANGRDQATGIVWASHPYKVDANRQSVEGVLRAYDASDLGKELWNSKVNPTRDNVGLFAKFCPPTVANGKVYLATFSKELAVYGLLS